MNSMLSEKRYPLFEGAFLSCLILAIFLLGSDGALVSYHGLLHTTIGNGVLQDGLIPENPYHAGTTLNYYTLYPALGVFLGFFLNSPFWGFAVINVLSAFCFALALDFFGKKIDLSFGQRRCAFWATLLGFNLWGYWWGPEQWADLGVMPLMVLEPITQFYDLFSWDARLQSFLAKFLNISSFACSLPLMLFAIGFALSAEKKSNLYASIALGFCVALNPLVGAFTTFLLLSCVLVVSENYLSTILEWAKYGIVSLLIATPFCVSLFLGEAGGENQLAPFPFVGDGSLFNLIGPNLVLIFFFIASITINKLRSNFTGRKFLLIALAWTVIFALFELPFDNQYKFSRLAAIFLGLAVAPLVLEIHRANRVSILVLLALSLPVTFLTARAYIAWDVSKNLSFRINPLGAPPKIEMLREGLPVGFIEVVKHYLPSDAVILMHPRHPGAASKGLGAQGNQWAPLLGKPLFVDLLQIHNQSYTDHSARLDASVAIWEGKRWPARKDSPSYDSELALQDAREALPERHLAILSLDAHTPSKELFERQNGSLVGSRDGISIWLFNPLNN